MKVIILLWLISFQSFSYSASIDEENSIKINPLSVEQQILEQMDSLTLLDLAPLAREELIEKLKKDLNIHIVTDDPVLFNRYFLSYIYNYFQTMKPDRLIRPLYNLHALDQPSPHLVSIQDNNLYFSHNAGDNIITKQLREIMDHLYEEGRDRTFPDEIQLTFEYNNELYAQLNKAVLSSEEIMEFIKKHSDIVFHIEGLLPLAYKNVKSFTRDELLLILEQYLDLPEHIRDNLALKRIIRVSRESSLFYLFSTVLGTYNPSTQTITLTDAAFNREGTDDTGEGTILHEVGHAFWGKSIWQGLSQEAKREYEQLSWNGDEIINNDFVSDYSTTNVKEDFAEHFAAYINDSEELQHKVKSKFNWLREHIFFNTEYYSDVADNLKIFVESEDGDKTPPYFINSPAESVSITLENPISGWPGSDWATIKVEIEGLFDDISGIKEIEIYIESENDSFWIMATRKLQLCDTQLISDLTPNKLRRCLFFNSKQPGWYSYYDTERLVLHYPGDYKITRMNLTDRAGNEKTIRSNLGNKTLSFPGTKHIAEKERREAEQKNIEAERKKEAEEARLKQEAEEARLKQEAEEARLKQEAEEARLKQIAETATGFNISNQSEVPITVYQDADIISHLQPKQCISISQQQLSSLRLKKITDWFDWELDALICTNNTLANRSTLNRRKCNITATSLIKKNDNNDYILTNYQGETDADFSQCNSLQTEEANQQQLEEEQTARQKQLEEKNRRKRASEEAIGLNISNQSEVLLQIYQDTKVALELEPGECISIMQQQLSSLRLRKVTDWFDLETDDFICSNDGIPTDIQKCNVNKLSLLTQNKNGDHILTAYQDEKDADFSRCKILPLPADLNIFNQSDIPITIYQDQKVEMDLKPERCISINQRQLLSLRLQKTVSLFNTFICTNTGKPADMHKCNVTTNSLIKKNEDGNYVLVDYLDEEESDFSQCKTLQTTEIKQIETDSNNKDETSSKSPQEDNTPPYFIKSIRESISISTEESNESNLIRPGRMLITVEVEGLFDNLSGIKEMEMLFESQNDSFQITPFTTRKLCDVQFWPQTHYSYECTFYDPKKSGWYFYGGYVQLNRFYPGNYKLTKLILTDKAGNTRTINQKSNDITVFIPGTKLLINEDLIENALEIKTTQTSDGDTLAHILVPDMTNNTLHSIYLYFKGQETGEELSYSINMEQLSELNEQFNSPSVPGKMSLPIVIPQELTSEQYRIDHMHFNIHYQDDIDVSFSRSVATTYFDHISSNADHSIAQPVVADVSLEVLKESNRKGGNTSIRAKIPVTGLDRGRGHIDVIMRTPTGHKIRYSSFIKSNPNDDTRYIEAVFDLKPYHTAGEYMITYMSMSEDYSDALNTRVNSTGSTLYRGARQFHEANLIHRGIRKTLTISTPPVELEPH